jgi:hypothetical protein
MIDNALCIQPLTSMAAVFPEKFDISSSTVTCFTGGNCSKPEIPILNRNSHFKYKYLGQTYGQTVGDQQGGDVHASTSKDQMREKSRIFPWDLGPGAHTTWQVTTYKPYIFP